MWVVIDPAGKTEERNDPTAIGVIGLRADGVVMVLHMEAKRREYPEVRQRAKDRMAEWRADGGVGEDTSNGLALGPDLRAVRRAASMSSTGSANRPAPRWPCTRT